MKIIKWERSPINGMYQLVADDGGDEYIETGRDVTEAPCRTLWAWIKEENPDLDNYRDFCRAYKAGKKEYEAYCDRDERRYKKYWRK